MKKLFSLIAFFLLLSPFAVSAQQNLVQGGTGLSTYAAGDIPYATSNTLRFSKLNIGAAGTCLMSSGTLPQWTTCTTGGNSKWATSTDASGLDIFNNMLGNVGIGTSTPVSRLTIATTTFSNAAIPLGELIGNRGLINGLAGGTMLGVVSDPGFTGSLLALQMGGVPKLYYDAGNSAFVLASPLIRNTNNENVLSDNNGGLLNIYGDGTTLTHTETTATRNALDIDGVQTWAPNTTNTAVWNGVQINPTLNPGASNSGGTFYATRINPTITATTGLTAAYLFGVSKSSVDQFDIDTNGNVGIGTTTPSSKLVVQTGVDVSGGFTNKGGLTIDSSGSAGANLQIASDRTSTASIFFSNQDDATSGQIEYSNGSGRLRFIAASTTAGNMRFDTAGGSRMVIDKNGNVVIGGAATADSGLLESDTAVGALGAVPGNFGAIDTTSSAIGVGGKLVFGGNYTGTTQTTAASIRAMKTNGTAGDFQFDLSFATRDGVAGSPLEKMRLSSQGLLGIGTTTPGAYLAVQSNSTTVDVMTLATTTQKAIEGVDASGHNYTSGTAPALSACGTGSPTVSGDDKGGAITTGTAATSCTLTFNIAYPVSPYCMASDNSGAVTPSVTTTTGGITFGLGAGLSGGVIYYECSYHRN